MRQFFSGEKRLLKLNEVLWVKRSAGFRELSFERLLSTTSKAEDIFKFLPDIRVLAKLDRTYTLNVGSQDHQHH